MAFEETEKDLNASAVIIPKRGRESLPRHGLVSNG